MPQQIQSADGQVPLDINTIADATEGTGWVSGCGVYPVASVSAIRVGCTAGRVRVAGSILDVPAQQVTLQGGAADYPRRDLIYLDYDGTLRVATGEARSRLPEDATRWGCFQPDPPDAANIDGVTLAEVWVAPGREASEDLTLDDFRDRRVFVPSASGELPEYDTDPPAESLLTARVWYNRTADQLRAYKPVSDKIVQISTTDLQTGVAPDGVYLEDFDDPLGTNWRGGDSKFSTGSQAQAFQGAGCAVWSSSGFIRKYSLPGDGLAHYPGPGDTIRVAGWATDENEYTYVGFGKSGGSSFSEKYYHEYRAYFDFDANYLELARVDESDLDDEMLGRASVTYTDNTWYVMDIAFDGAGEGQHVLTLYETGYTGGGAGTVGAQVAQVTGSADTTYRGRGISIGAFKPARLDALEFRPGA